MLGWFGWVWVSCYQQVLALGCPRCSDSHDLSLPSALVQGDGACQVPSQSVLTILHCMPVVCLVCWAREASLGQLASVGSVFASVQALAWARQSAVSLCGCVDRWNMCVRAAAVSTVPPAVYPVVSMPPVHAHEACRAFTACAPCCRQHTCVVSH